MFLHPVYFTARPRRLQVVSRLRTAIARVVPLPGHFVGDTENYTAGEVSAPVCWLPNRVIGVPGKTTVFNTIWLNERVKQDLPAELVAYIFLHEHGHATRSAFDRLRFVSLTIGLAVIAAALVCFAITVGVIALFASVYSVVQGAIVVVVSLGLAAVAGEGYRRVVQHEELRAELNVVQELGPIEYRRRHAAFEERRDRGVISRIRRHLLYPSPDTVVTEFRNQ